MPTCTSPLRGWRDPETGGILLNQSVLGILGKPMNISVPCGNCMGCRLARVAEWACRLENESLLHDENSYVTLTYNDDKLPSNSSLDKNDIQKFIKRLRKYLEPKKISYYIGGEYGDFSFRPHYHGIIFNYWPEDVEYIGLSKARKRMYSSEKLNGIWKNGYVTVGEVTFESCAYCASYVTKKIKGDETYQKAYYGMRDSENSWMSRRPAIGKRWWEQYKETAISFDSMVSRGHERRLPRYYRKLHKAEDIMSAHAATRNRIDKSKEYKIFKAMDPRDEEIRLMQINKFNEDKQAFFKKSNI